MKFVTQDVGRATVKLIDDDKVAAIIKNEGSFEPQSLKVWADVCAASEGKTVIDVGAYSGLFAISAALVGCHAIAVEPNANLADRIVWNARINGTCVHLVIGAASSRNGVEDLHMNGARFSVAASLLRNETKHNRSIKINTYTLDWLSQGLRVSAIKIDVEGSESDVLAGALGVIEREKPILLIETMDDQSRKDRAMSLLSGYRCAGFLDGRNLHMVPA